MIQSSWLFKDAHRFVIGLLKICLLSINSIFYVTYCSIRRRMQLKNIKCIVIKKIDENFSVMPQWLRPRDN